MPASAGDLVLLRDITQHTECLVAREGQVVGSGAQRLFVDIGQDHGGAPFGEGLCGGQAYAGAAAGNQGDLTGEVIARIHRCPLSLRRLGGQSRLSIVS